MDQIKKDLMMLGAAVVGLLLAGLAVKLGEWVVGGTRGNSEPSAAPAPSPKTVELQLLSLERDRRTR